MNVKKTIIILLIFFLFPSTISAQRGCCSNHGGVAGCSSNGKQVCGDGSLSPSCTCTPPAIYGCTDYSAKNYNSNANKDDGSCQYYIKGCMDQTAKNYNSSAEKDDGSCEYYKTGCMDQTAKNYDSSAEKDDGSCQYPIKGCMDKNADNYDASVEQDDGSCMYLKTNDSNDSSVSSDDVAHGLFGLSIIGTAVGLIVNKNNLKRK